MSPVRKICKETPRVPYNTAVVCTRDLSRQLFIIAAAAFSYTVVYNTYTEKKKKNQPNSTDDDTFETLRVYNSIYR